MPLIRTFSLCLLSIVLGACEGFQGASDTLDPSGPVSLKPYGYSLEVLPKSSGQVGLFELAYRVAFSDAQRINEGQLESPTSSSDPVSIRARRMALEGVHLADSYCALFFAYGSDNQKWLLVAKDVVAALGTIATGAVALASPHNATAAGAIALSTAALYTGVDIYTRNFLFHSDNIDAVRSMTLNALAAHSAKALPENDSSIWTFGGAAQVINEHQALCFPASIRSLVLAALKTSTFTATSPTGAAPNPASTAPSEAASAVAPVAAAAVARAAPAAADAAVPAANAAAAAAGPAAAVAASQPNANIESIRAAARAAAAAGARAAISAAMPGASTSTVQAGGKAAADIIAPAAAAATAPNPAGVAAPPPTRQLNLTPNAANK
jgi:hypothetical protein